MLPKNYNNPRNPHTGDSTSYEEQILLNYDNYLQAKSKDSSPAKNYFSLKLSDLEDLYMTDFLNSEYDENDWEEEEIDANDIDDDLTEDYDENDKEVETFSDDGYKID